MPRQTFWGHTECRICVSTRLRNEFASTAIRGLWDEVEREALREASIARAAGILPRAAQESWKPNTASKYADSARIIMSWGEARGIELLGSAVVLTPGIVACYYLDRVDEGEGVAPATANKELTVFSHWWDRLVERYPKLNTGVHPVRNRLMDDLKKRANLWYQEEPVGKVGFDEFDLRKLFGNGRTTGTWRRDHTCLSVGLMWFHLLRSVAAGHVVWRGDWQGPTAAFDSDVVWRRDPVHGPHQVVDVARDKTQRNLQKSNRFLPEENGTDIDFGAYVRDYIRTYKVPNGTYLLAVRREDGSFHDTPFTNWSRVVNDACAIAGLDRKEYGTHSFRRGCAEWLNENGVDFDQIGLLGFWMTRAMTMHYSRVKAAPRLQAWATARRSKAQAKASRRANDSGGRL